MSGCPHSSLPRFRSNFHGKHPQISFFRTCNDFSRLKAAERATPVGYAALIDAHGLKVPMPRMLSAVGPRHKAYEQDGWHLYTPRHAPPASLEGHLTFACTAI